MKPKQLFCFTYAGGTSSFFDELGKELSGIEVVKLDYAGHGERHKENFYENFDGKHQIKNLCIGIEVDL